MVILKPFRPMLDELIFRGKVEKIIKTFKPYISRGDRVLDLGSGIGIFTKILRDRGYNISPIDVRDKSLYTDVRPLIYDGEKLPFKKNEFDVCLLIAVLHHTPQPEKVIKEAKRVSKKLIILENVIDNRFQESLTYLADSLLNLEFFGHPHTNRTDEHWRETFQRLGLEVAGSKSLIFWGFLHDVIYILKKSKT